jgi:hypothetical protein
MAPRHAMRPEGIVACPVLEGIGYAIRRVPKKLSSTFLPAATRALFPELILTRICDAAASAREHYSHRNSARSPTR